MPIELFSNEVTKTMNEEIPLEVQAITGQLQIAESKFAKEKEEILAKQLQAESNFRKEKDKLQAQIKKLEDKNYDL